MRQVFITTREHLEVYCSGLLDQYPDEKSMPEFGIHFLIKVGQRTKLQNNAVHQYFENVATALNDAGLEIHMEYLGKAIEVPWTKESVKERLWLPIMETMTGKSHTADLERNQVSPIYDVLARFLAEKQGISVPFPQEDYG